MNIGILHYAAPPGVGGVEQTIYYHARELTRAGHHVRVLAGVGEPFDPQVELVLAPEFGSTGPEVLAVKKELDRGEVTETFHSLRRRCLERLREALAGVETLIVHNVLTLHKNLPLTAALYELSGAGHPLLVGWHHDLAWEDPRYGQDLFAGYPWDLLRRPWPGVRHVTVSLPQRDRLAALYGLDPREIAVVPPGVDAARFFRWTETTRGLVGKLGLLEAGLLLLLPARLTRRKNVEMALRVLAELRHDGSDARLVVTGPPGPHNPANQAYLESLLALRRELGLEQAAHLLYELGITPDDESMADLYSLADALLFPSAQEGFGIPVLEAGLARLPAFCSDIPALRETGRSEASFFSLQDDPAHVARLIRDRLGNDPAHGLFRRVLEEYQWERIVRRQILPLLGLR